LEIKKPIVTEDEGLINTIKIKGHTYIPLSVIPKVLRPTFTHKEKPKNVTYPHISTVINVNGKNFIPINNKTVKPIHIENVKFVPVYNAPAGLVISKPIIATKKSKDTPIKTIVLGNITYIPTHSIPKAYHPVFLNKPVKVNETTVHKYVV
jgi:hypothetical protein